MSVTDCEGEKRTHRDATEHAAINGGRPASVRGQSWRRPMRGKIPLFCYPFIDPYSKIAGVKRQSQGNSFVNSNGNESREDSEKKAVETVT